MWEDVIIECMMLADDWRGRDVDMELKFLKLAEYYGKQSETKRATIEDWND